jgi:hypothetical protein
MAAGMSVAEGRVAQRFRTIIVVGGGCYGGYYLRQLGRAVKAGALSAESIVIVDRDPHCAVAKTLADGDAASPVTTLDIAEWREYFSSYLTRAADSPEQFAQDAIVPSPLMPHLMAEWLVERAKSRWPSRNVRTASIESPLAVRWQRDGADGTHYVSFADWMCPINCIEPRLCPVTRDVRDWSLPGTIAAFAHEHGMLSAVMHCRHRAYGVGMFDTAEVIAADGAIRDAGNQGTAGVIIGTASHCHGALTRLLVE